MIATISTAKPRASAYNEGAVAQERAKLLNPAFLIATNNLVVTRKSVPR